MMIRIRPKKTFILIARFWARKSRLQKTAKIKKFRRTSAANTSIFGCEIDEKCSKSYKKIHTKPGTVATFDIYRKKVL